MSGYRPLKPAGIGWTIFKVLYPFSFPIIGIILTILLVTIFTILMLIPGAGTITGIVGGITTTGIIAITGVILGIMMFICTILTLYRVYKRKLSLKSPYVWFCYILYSFIPGGSFVTAWELR